MTLDEDMRRALGLAEQIIAEMPDHWRPEHNLADMRRLLNGGSTGRDALIVVHAAATALAWLSRQPPPAQSSEAVMNRLQDFCTLIKLSQRCEAWTFATYFAQGCWALDESEKGKDDGIAPCR